MLIQQRKNKGVAIPTTTLLDQSLSWEALGLLCFMLSQERAQMAELVARTTGGTDRMSEILEELELLGYIKQYVATADKDGSRRTLIRVFATNGQQQIQEGADE